MSDTWHAAHAAFQQCFRALATQLRQNHAAWREAVRVHDRPRQSALIAREGVIFTEVHAVIAAFQATIAQRHRAREVAARSAPVGGTRPATGSVPAVDFWPEA